MCVAVSYMCVVPIGGQVCCIRYKDIGISIVVVFLVLYIGNICVDLIDIFICCPTHSPGFFGGVG